MLKGMLTGAALMMLSPLYAAGMMSDDPLLHMLKVEKFEFGFNDENPTRLEAKYWLGKDLHKFYAKTEVENAEGDNESANLELLYSRAIDAYWDLQMGVKREFEFEENRDALAIGFQGLAPYYFEIDTALYVYDSGQTELSFEAEYELMLTQQWVLSPVLEARIFGENEPENEVGSGLSKLEFGIRLRYEITREFAPYIGWQWEKSYGNTRRYHAAEGESVSETMWVAGFRFWY